MEQDHAHQDPRLTFTTPEFKAAQRTFAQNLAVRMWKMCLFMHVKRGVSHLSSTTEQLWKGG